MLALSAVSSGYVYGCGCVCELGHILLAFDLGEALRCMPRCERLGCSLLSHASDFVAAPVGLQHLPVYRILL